MHFFVGRRRGDAWVRIAALFLFMIFLAAGAISAPAEAGVRRALVIGVSDYSDGLRKLAQASNDADSMEKTLAGKGFDFKVTRLTTADLKDRAAFDKAFEEFLATVNERDEIVVYVSSHGLGHPDPKKGNFFLLLNAQSREHFIEKAKRDSSYEAKAKSAGTTIESLARTDYTTKIESVAIPEAEIIERIRSKKTSIVILIADACRTQVLGKDVDQDPDSAANMHFPEKTRGVFRFYAAQPGKAALESEAPRHAQRQLSVFTGELLIHLRRPEPIGGIAYRVSAGVRRLTTIQVPDWNKDFDDDYQLYRGAEGDRPSCDKFAEVYQRLFDRRQRNSLSAADVDVAIADYRYCSPDKRDALEALRDSQRQELVLDQGFRSAQEDTSIDKCDAEAASPYDPQKPQRVRGVDLQGRALAVRFATDAQKKSVRDGIAEAIGNCEVSIKNAPKNFRFKFNMSRAQHAAALLAKTNEERLKFLSESTRLLKEAANEGYTAAFNNLAVMYDSGEAVEDVNGTLQQLPRDHRLAFQYYTQGADRGHQIARYNLAAKLKDGQTGEIGRNIGVDRTQAYRFFSQAAEAGYVPAMIETGKALRYGIGIDADPKRALAMFETAARRGSGEAMYQTGLLYFEGQTKGIYQDRKLVRQESIFSPDWHQSLIWMLRAAETGHLQAIQYAAQLLRYGEGVPVRQPDAAARYLRLAVNAGSAFAQAELADMLKRGEVQRRPNEPIDFVVQLLKRAEENGDPKAALSLAKIFDEGLTIGTRQIVEPNREEAVRLAERAYSIASFSPIGHEYAKPTITFEAAALLIRIDSKGAPLLTAPSISTLRELYGGPETKPIYIELPSAQRSCGTQVFAIWPSKKITPLAPQIEWYQQARSCRFWKRTCDYLAKAYETARKKDGDIITALNFDEYNKIQAEEENKDNKLKQSGKKPEEDRFECNVMKVGSK